MDLYLVRTSGEDQKNRNELSMDTNHVPDNHIPSLLHSHTASLDAAFGVRAQTQQEQQEQQQQQMLPAQRFLEVGTG